MHSDASSPTAKRRKVRKGTQSCSECYRRKVRCTFASPANSVCDNCRRRKTTCISQNLDEGPERPKQSADGMEKRLGRVEEMLERLIAQPNPQAASANVNDTPEQSYREPLLTPACTVHSLEASLADSHTGLARQLLAVWPTLQDLEQIYALPVGLATHLHMTICEESSESSSREPSPTREMLRLPPQGSHPVLFGRKLLYLASLLQGALSASTMLAPRQGHFHEVMSRALNTAIRLVTTNEEFTISIEGLECIMVEATIHNNAGHLHRAWMAIHRAATVAQMMGLHRGSKSTSRFLEPATKAAFNSDKVCFVIINVDCYLSVTLGLPRSSFETCALTPEALARCQPLERLARLQCIIADRVMRQGDGDTSTQAYNVHVVEKLLQDAVAEMAPQWWLTPDFEPSGDDTTNPYKEIGRVNYQFAHYLLTLRLHLPFLLRPPQDSAYNHSKLVAAATSRDILSLYITLRKWNAGCYYCRSIDYLVFVTTTTLCIAHVNARSTIRMVQSNSCAEKTLLQSRLRDRVLMGRTFDILQQMKDDEIATKLVRIMQHVLEVEADASNGAEYSAMATESDIAATACEGEFVDGNKSYQLRMPFFGVVDLRRQPVLIPGQSSALGAQRDPRDGASSTRGDEQIQPSFPEANVQWSQQGSWLPSEVLGQHGIDTQLPGFLDMPDDWTLQSINDSLFDSLFGGMDDQFAPYSI
jgi:hypothetical protein